MAVDNNAGYVPWRSLQAHFPNTSKHLLPVLSNTITIFVQDLVHETFLPRTFFYAHQHHGVRSYTVTNPW